MRPVIVRITGSPGSGKTHFGLTFPDPLMVFNFDKGLNDAMKHFKGKDIEVVECALPIQWSSKRKTFGKKEWEQFYDVYKRGLDEKTSILVDTGTVLNELTREYIREKLGVQQLMPYMYGDVNAAMKALIDEAKDAGVNVVFTHHMKDVYVGENKTGEKEPDGWKRMEGLVDWDFVLSLEKKKGCPTESVFEVTKCRLDRELVGETFVDLSYDVMAGLVVGEEDE